MKRLFAAMMTAAILGAPAGAQEVARSGKSVVEVAPQLRNGEYVWAPELSPAGPLLLVVNLETQRAVLFRNGVPIGASTVSSGKPGHETPMGVFTILQKRKEHYSSTYNNAPMPNMQRLTWKGIALHAGNLPGYPASHGCVRLPLKFSELLFGATTVGMTVVVTSISAIPMTTADPIEMVEQAPQRSLANAPFGLRLTTSDDPIAIVISTADRRAIVLQSGKEVGSAPVRVSDDLSGSTAYVLRAWDAEGKHWLKLRFAGSGGSEEVGAEEAGKLEAPAEFKSAIAAAVRPGSVVVITPQSLKWGSPGAGATVIEDEASSRQ